MQESSCELGLEWDLWGGPVGLTVAALQPGRCHGGDVVFVCVRNVLRSGAGGEAHCGAGAWRLVPKSSYELGLEMLSIRPSATLGKAVAMRHLGDSLRVWRQV